jgi:hypothetical protein
MIPDEMKSALLEMMSEKVFYTCFKKTINKANLYQMVNLLPSNKKIDLARPGSKDQKPPT